MSDPCQPTNLLAQPERQIFLPGFLETIWISTGIIAMLWSHACLPAPLSSWILFIVLPKLAFLLWITQLSITSIRRHLKKPFSSRVLCYYFSHSGFIPLVLKIGPIQSQFYHRLKICILDSPVIDIKGSPTGLSALLAPTWPIQLSYPSDNLFRVSYKSGCVVDSKTWKSSEESYPKESLSVKILNYKPQNLTILTYENKN